MLPHQQQLIADLLFLPSAAERLECLVQRAAARGLPLEQKIEPHRVHGCQSPVWLIGHQQADRTWLWLCDADSPMVKGLATCLCDWFSGCDSADILTGELPLWQATGLHKHLSPTRQRGLQALHERIQQLCQAD